MAKRRGLAVSLVIVIASMLLLYTVPPDYFVGATFVSTSCMIGAAFALGALRGRRLLPKSVGLGVASAALLYGTFYAGAWAVSTYHPFGITSASETSIYSLISSPRNPIYLQVLVLFFDSAGFEAFFRGVLQKRLSARSGLLAAPAVSLLDAGIHAATLNPLWVSATFITDLVWGLTYYYGKGAQSSFASHFVWDVAIFILRPIK